MNLRRRVTLALLGVVLLFIGSLTVLAYISIEDQEDDLVDALVMQQARDLAERAERGELQGPAAAAYLQPSPYLSAWLLPPEAPALPEPVPAHLARLSDGAHRLERPRPHLHAAVLRTGAGRLFVQYDAEQNESKVHEFGWYLLGLALSCALLAWLVSWRVAGWVVRPIERLAMQLTQWAPNGADTPQARSSAESDEETQLLRAFRRVQDRFEQSVAREREFVANLSHEIRTPLAALRTDLELLQAQATADSPQQQRLRRSLLAVDNISGTLTAARTLAGPASAAQPGAALINLCACVDEAWSSVADATDQQGLRFRNAVALDAEIMADRHALLTILRNLFRNALEHAAPAECVVQLSARGIEVSDDGPGIAEADLPFVFERYYRGRLSDLQTAAQQGDATRTPAANQGLGLAIARQLAELHGWDLRVEPALTEPRRGTRFVLSLVAPATF